MRIGSASENTQTSTETNPSSQQQQQLSAIKPHQKKK